MPPPPAPHPAAPALPPPPVAGGPPGVAAVVNGQTITRAQLAQTALAMSGNDALREAIVNTLINQAAKAHHIIITHAEVTARFNEIKAEIDGSYPPGFDAYLQAHNMTASSILSNLRTDVLAEKLATQGKPQPHLVHIHYLVVLTGNPHNDATVKPHTPAEALDIIQKAQADLASGQSFEAVAEKYSDDPSVKVNHGDLGVIGAQSSGQYVPAFVEAAMKLKPGEVSAPVIVPNYGDFLLKAVSTSEHPINVETHKPDTITPPSPMGGITHPLPAYDQMEQAQARTAAQAYLATLLAKAKITNYFQP
jgi:hypothetical protein